MFPQENKEFSAIKSAIDWWKIYLLARNSSKFENLTDAIALFPWISFRIAS